MAKAESWGVRIRKARLDRGMPADELAKKAKVARTTIYGIESGHRQPRPTTLRKILQALEKTPKLPEI
jgi:transcriptional regulator with XRE-family HTH domain